MGNMCSENEKIQHIETEPQAYFNFGVANYQEFPPVIMVMAGILPFLNLKYGFLKH